MDKHLMIAEAYYQALGNKSISDVEKYLHPDVQFISPLANTKGKKVLLESVKHYCSLFKSLTIQERFSQGDNVMLVYNLDCPMPIGSFRAAVLMSFKDELISSIELFYDARPFEK